MSFANIAINDNGVAEVANHVTERLGDAVLRPLFSPVFCAPASSAHVQ